MGLRKQTMGKFAWENRCQCCGQYIVEGQDFYIIYPDGNKKIEWGIAHCNELDAIGTIEEQMKYLEYRTTPRFKGWTIEQKTDAQIFYEVCSNYGFNKKTMSKRTMKCKKQGSSATICYDMISRELSFDSNYKRGLFDGIFERELLDKIENEFRKCKKLPLKKVQTAQKTINEAIKKVDEIFGT